MKVYFDIITNHTADVIGYEGGARTAVRLQGRRALQDGRRAPSSTTATSPAAASRRWTPRQLPVHAVLAAGRADLKVPAWLNDLTLYHNRGDTTFMGEDSLYGDFFGLDDLFTEHPRVVQGMIDIYQTWIRDFGIDGFRIDTMKHVDDEFWQQFAPEVLDYARALGKDEFFMFGEVFDTTKASRRTSPRRTACRPCSTSRSRRRRRASRRTRSPPARSALLRGRRLVHRRRLERLPAADVPREPRHGADRRFVKGANADATDAELLARDRLAHELMYLSRGNPVVYYGDEQGFTGTGGDQLARRRCQAAGFPTTSGRPARLR